MKLSSKDIARLKRELDKLTLVQLIIALTILTIFLIIPIASLLGKAFIYENTLSLKYFEEAFLSPGMVKFPPTGAMVEVIERHKFVTLPNGTRILKPLKTLYIGGKGPDFGYILNSIFVSTSVMIFASILGLIAAFIMARYEFPGKNIFRVLLMIPLLATPFVNAYVIGKVIGPGGLLNYILKDLLHLTDYTIVIIGLPAVILVQTLSFFPIVYLNMLSSFINIDPSLEEQAENMGAHGFKLFRTVTLPLALPGLAAGATLVFIFSLEDLGAPIGLSGAFGTGLHSRLMSFYVYEEFRKAMTLEQVHPVTYAVAVLMLGLAAVAFLSIKKYVTLKQYAMLAKGGRWSPRVRKPGIKGLLAIYLFLVPLVIVASFPQLGVVTLAITDWAISGVLPTKLTGEFLMALVTKSDVVQAIRNSLTYASLAIIVIVLTGTSAAYIVARRDIPGKDIIDLLATIPIAIPGIIVAVGYLLFFGTVFSNTSIDPFINPGLLLIFSYSVRRLPFTTRAVFAGLQQTHVSLEEAAETLGASRTRTFFTIVIPLLAANIIGGAILAFVYSMSEVSTSVILGSRNPAQGPITFLMSQVIYASAAVGTVSIAAALGVLLMTLQIIAITVSNYILKQRVAFLGV
ncbi:MAG: iron ABC transporter permease [Desulfurococcales archaeon ex4484_217_2]|nr:MAG: iron ABC transporter permease [Desulfurococcales archaeon ex4484_217_2]